MCLEDIGGWRSKDAAMAEVDQQRRQVRCSMEVLALQLIQRAGDGTCI